MEGDTELNRNAVPCFTIIYDNDVQIRRNAEMRGVCAFCFGGVGPCVQPDGEGANG